MGTTLSKSSFEKRDSDSRYSAVEYDIGSGRTTNSRYGQLKIRKNFDTNEYEVYDVDDDEVVESHTNLEVLIVKARNLTSHEIHYKNYDRWDTV